MKTIQLLLMVIVTLLVTACSYPVEPETRTIQFSPLATDGDSVVDTPAIDSVGKPLHILMTDSGSYEVRDKNSGDLLFYGTKTTHDDTIVAFCEYRAMIDLFFSDSTRNTKNGLVGLTDKPQLLYLWYSDYWNSWAFGKSNMVNLEHYNGELSPNWEIYKGED